MSTTLSWGTCCTHRYKKDWRRRKKLKIWAITGSKANWATYCHFSWNLILPIISVAVCVDSESLISHEHFQNSLIFKTFGLICTILAFFVCFPLPPRLTDCWPRFFPLSLKHMPSQRYQTVKFQFCTKEKIFGIFRLIEYQTIEMAVSRVPVNGKAAHLIFAI